MKVTSGSSATNGTSSRACSSAKMYSYAFGSTGEPWQKPTSPMR